MVITVFVSVLVSITRIQVRQNANAEVNSQSTFLLQTIQRYVEQSSLVEANSDSVSSTLKLRMASSSADPTIIYLSNGTVYVQQSSTPAFALTSGKITVSNLSFAKRANVSGHDAVSVSFTVAYNAPNILSNYLQGLNLSVARVSAAIFDSNIVPSANNTYKIGTAVQDWQSINNTLFFDANGYVGLGAGASTPGSRLDLAGALTFRGMAAPSTSTAGQALLYFDSTANALKLSQNAGAYATIGSSQWTTSGTAIYYNTGNVGIGTANPTGNASSVLQLDGGTSQIHLTSATSGATLSDGSLISHWSDNNLYINNQEAGSIQFNTNGGARMTIASSGNVGIGTTGPVSKLEILSNGSATLSDISVTAANSAFVVSGAYGANYYYPLVGLRISDNNPTVVNAGMYAQLTAAGSNLILGGSNSYSQGIDPSIFIKYDGNVGIGTTAPSSTLHVSGNVTFNKNGDMAYLIFQRDFVTKAQITSDNAGTSGGNLVFYTKADSGDGSGAIAQKMQINANGNVGIGTYGYNSRMEVKQSSNSPGGTLRTIRSDTTDYVDWFTGADNKAYVQINASGYCGFASGGSWACASDERLKNNIATLDNSLEKIINLRGVSYDMKDEPGPAGERIGVIAQEVEKQFPQLVSTGPNGMKSVQYDGLVAPLIEAVKELAGMINDLKLGLAKFARLAADYVETRVLKADYATLPNGVTTNDAATGAPYCIRVTNGEVKAAAGECK